ncbi:MAG: hypothetical protein ACTHMO_12800 [Rhodanobacteraceae bacterium]
MSALAYYYQHRDEINTRRRAQRRGNADYLESVSTYRRQFRRERPEVVRARERAKRIKRASDPSWRLRKRISNRVRRCLRGELKRSSISQSLEYTISELRSHLERQFLRGMSWENMGEWHIDHIVPLSAFDITTEDSDGFKRAWALSNLRPLWAAENLKKSSARNFLL